MTVSQSPEFQLLRLCGRLKLEPTHVLQLKDLISTGLDWNRLFALAQRHSLLSLIYWHLHRHCSAEVPSVILENLRRHFSSNLLRNELMTRELLRLVQVFREQEIPLIAYKGPTLSQLIYQNVGFREFSDLDILVRKEDIQRVKQLLMFEGYQPSYKLTPAQEAAFLDTNGEFIFQEAQHRIFLEVHWSVMPARFRFPIEPDTMWNSLKPVALNGIPVPSLGNEDLLLVLCVHNSKHLWEKMLWVCDVAELLRIHGSEIDWKRFWIRAENLGSLRKVCLGIYLASTLLDAPISHETGQSMQSQTAVKSVAKKITSQLASENNALSGRSKVLLNVKIADRFPDAFRFLYRRALTPTVEDWSAVPLPDYLYPLYYPVRLIRSTAQYLGQLATKVRRAM